MADWNILSRIAERSIRRHWRYSLGAFLSVVAGFLSLSLFRAYMADVAFLYEDTYSHRNMYGQLLIEKEGDDAQRRGDPWAFVLDEGDQAFLEKYLADPRAQVRNRVRFLTASGMISNGRANTIFWAKGYDIQAGALMRGHKWGWDVVAGLPLQLASGNENIVIGRSLARILECDVPSAGRKLYSAEGGYAEEKRPYDCPQPQLQLGVTTPNGQQNAIDMNVVGVVDGIFKEVDTKYVMMSLPLMQRLFDTKGVSFYSVQLQRGADVPAFLSSLTAAAREQGHHLRAQRWQDHPEGDLYLRTMELLSIFRNFVIGIMIGITGLSVFNAFLKSVNERTREIGTMRSLGYRRRSIIGLFGLEAVYLSVGGCAAGAVCGLVATHLINSAAILYKAGILAEPVPFRLAYDFPIYLTSAAFLVAVGVGAAVLAVHSTVTRPIAENLVHA